MSRRPKEPPPATTGHDAPQAVPSATELRGGMATVYLADDPKHARQGAMKVLHADVARHRPVAPGKPRH